MLLPATKELYIIDQSGENGVGRHRMA